MKRRDKMPMNPQTTLDSEDSSRLELNTQNTEVSEDDKGVLVKGLDEERIEQMFCDKAGL